MVMRVASFFPFQTTYYLNGHSFIEQELKRAQIGFRKTDNAFLAVDDVAACKPPPTNSARKHLRQQLDDSDPDPGTEVLRQGAQAAQSPHASTPSPRSSIAATHLQAQLSPSTNSSNAAASSACGG